MISERINNVLNTQINKEFYSAYLYLSMATFFHSNGLKGFAHWSEIQAREEVEHGMAIFNYINDLNGKIELMQINPPEITFRSALEAFKIGVTHEKHLSESINHIAILADEENDNVTKLLIDKFIHEQAEEEAHTSKIYSKLKMFGDSKSALYLIDKELGERAYEAFCS